MNMSNKKVEIIITGQGHKKYKCQKCGQTSKRRFNLERHYTRFHEQIILKTCCGKTFYIKSDLYEHKEKVHYEKKYVRGQNQRTVIEQNINNVEISVRLSETQNNESSLQFKRFNPKKHWLHNWQKNSSDQLQGESSRAPLSNVENVMSKKVATKKQHTPQKIINSNFSIQKENIEIYNITYHPTEGIDKELFSINF